MTTNPAIQMCYRIAISQAWHRSLLRPNSKVQGCCHNRLSSVLQLLHEMESCKCFQDLFLPFLSLRPTCLSFGAQTGFAAC